MGKKLINSTHIEGLLYQHSLELKTSGENSKNPGTEYITGNIEIATDGNIVNIVPVHFTYVTATTAKGKSNDTFTALKNIIDKVYKSCMEHGKDNATKFRIDSAIGLNEFYSDRNGQEELISVKRNEGGFLHVTPTLEPEESKRNRFDVDMLITGARHIEPDEEKKITEKVIVKGAIFNFRGDIMPVEFSATDPRAMAYFEGLEASSKNPIFTRIKGAQISESVKTTVTANSAFGAPDVKEYTNIKKDFVIDWAAEEPYEWDTEETLTAATVETAMKNRELALAEMKKRADDYKASKGNAISSTAPASGGFNF